MTISYQRGIEHIGRPVTETDVFNFIANCVKVDNDILFDYDGSIVDGVHCESWMLWEMWTDKITDDTNYNYIKQPLNVFFDNCDMWRLSDLFYLDENNKTVTVAPEDIIQVFLVGMIKYDTKYRICVFEDKDHNLLLGNNNSD